MTATGGSFFRRKGDDGREHPAPTSGLEPGRVLGDFRLIRKLGEGGMGQVWEAVQVSLRRSVALKLMPSGRVLSDTALAMFGREAKAGGRLHHPSIVSVLAYGETEGVPFIAQELVGDGWTLKDVIQEARLAHELEDDWYERIATFFAASAEALAVAHDAGVIHRDLKPANILVADDDRPMIADFGLAKVSGVESISRTGELAGTYCYMSPEQAMAKRVEIDGRTDVFSLGTTLYEALTLVRAFDGDSQQQVTAGILWTDPPDPRSLRSKVPRDLSVICTKAMEKRPADRYASMAGFAADLRRHLADEPVTARPAGPLLRAGKWMRRHPTKSVALGLTAVALVAISVLALWQYRTANELSVALTDVEAQRDRADVTATELAGKNTQLTTTIGARDAALSDAETQRERADAKAAEARSNAEQAEAERADVLRLSAFQKLQDLRREADDLWPATPDKLPAYDAWLAGAAELVAGLDPTLDGSDPGHVAQLAALRERALPATAADLAPDPRHGSYDEWQQTQKTVEQTEAGLEQFRASLNGTQPSAEQAAQLAQVGATLPAARERLAELETALSVRTSWRFASADDTWWHNQLTKLIAEIEAFTDPGTGLVGGISAESGWGIARRREFAATVEERTVSGHEAVARWAVASDSIGDVEQCPKYDGLALSPQLGLLPIGRDKGSGLWEFWDVISGDEPPRDENGQLVLAESMGLVLVLIPGGTFWMGAQPDDPEGQNYDPGAQSDESPVHAVTLSPYFLSKYELTQGQWERFTGVNPSQYFVDNFSTTWNREGKSWSALHPVEQVSWNDCVATLSQFGLILPSEAQWENSCRTGTNTVCWSGNNPQLLQGVANLSDQYGKDHGNGSWAFWESWLDDGNSVHAEVGSYRPNGFGLYDTHGNVWEWCLDSYNGGFYGRSPIKDPLNSDSGARFRVLRGGGFLDTAAYARSAERSINAPDARDMNLGLRPAKDISK